MGRTDRRVLWIVIAGGYLILALVALLTANQWWLSGLVTASILAWLSGVLAAIYSTPNRRPAVLGAVLLGFLYILLAVGPWFRGNVGPWLLSTQVLVHAETHWLGRSQPPQQAIAWNTYPQALAFTNSNITSTWTTPSLAGLTGSALWTVPSQPQASHFVACGHWLVAWFAAATGGLVAAWIARRKRGQQPLAPGHRATSDLAPPAPTAADAPRDKSAEAAL